MGKLDECIRNQKYPYILGFILSVSTNSQFLSEIEFFMWS